MPRPGGTAVPTHTSEPASTLVTLITPAEAAKYLAISTRQLRDLTQNGSIRYVNIGQRDRETRRYHPADIEAFIEERRMRAPCSRVASPFISTEVLGLNDFQRQLARRR